MDKSTPLFDLKFDYLAKIIVMGNAGIGKTSFINKFMSEGTPSQKQQSSLDFEFNSKSVQVDDVVIKVQVWDYFNYEKILGFMGYRGTEGVIVWYNIADRISFEDIPKWMDLVERYWTAANYIIVGLKWDLDDQRQVTSEEARKLAEKYNWIYIETSSINGSNVNKVFDLLLHELAPRLKEEESIRIKRLERNQLRKQSSCW